MNTIKGIGFDLFDTLVTIDTEAVGDAFGRLTESLEKSGFTLDSETFRQTYRQEAGRFIKRARETGRETYNRLWIAAALNLHGYEISPDDERIAQAVDDYFSSFYSFCRPVPGALEVLGHLNQRYRLGLLSNFTYAPAVKILLDRLELSSFFGVILVSADLGYRKPHPMVFQTLARKLGLAVQQMMYIGDDPEPDIHGAKKAGLTPVWMTWVKEAKAALKKDLSKTGADSENGLRTSDPDILRISSWNDLLTHLGIS
jgi:HAD superfamily hydrolase (TIGR01549 family)